jgi:hypothetical protein
MLYGATGYTGGLIAQHALERGHRPRARRSERASRHRPGRTPRPAVPSSEPGRPSRTAGGTGRRGTGTQCRRPVPPHRSPAGRGVLSAECTTSTSATSCRCFGPLRPRRARREPVSASSPVSGSASSPPIAWRATSATGRRRRTSRGGFPNRLGPTGSRRGGNHAREPPLRRLDPPGGQLEPQGARSPESRRSSSPTDPAKPCPFRPVTSKQPSRPQALPTSSRTPSALPPSTLEHQLERMR